MPAKDDGGPAFPRPCDPCSCNDFRGSPCTVAYDGMFLRDWFAGTYRLLPADIAYVERHDPDGGRLGVESSIRYCYADAMLAKRKENDDG